jgi:hypothetical protein
MATSRYLWCSACKEWFNVRSLFDALHQPCELCGLELELRLEFDLGLGVGRCEVRVLGAFLPEELDRWTYRRVPITYYPFLVVTETIVEHKRSVWLPYWHLKRYSTGTVMRYGQWAPYLGRDRFKSIVRKAKRAGLI